MTTDEETIDRHLGIVLNEVITAIQTIKQAVWSASTADVRQALGELRSFLADQAAALAEAEESINGRAESVLNPTAHTLRNLRADAGHDQTVFRALVLDNLRELSADARSRAEEIADAPQATLFVELADGLDHRLNALAADG